MNNDENNKELTKKTDMIIHKFLESNQTKEIKQSSNISNILKKLQFSDIFDIKEIQKIQDTFAKATGVASLITAPDGTNLLKWWFARCRSKYLCWG